MTNSNPLQPTLQQVPSADLRALQVAFGLEVKKQINCARIGIIQSFDVGNQTAVVQIAQNQVTSVSPSGVRTIASFAPLLQVPVYILGGGGHSATFPIAKGDEALIVFNDRELDNWFNNGGITTPTSARIHDLSDGMCFVGFRSAQRSLSGYSTDSAQLRSDDGQTYVDVNGTTQTIKLVAPVQVILQAPLTTIVGNMNVEGTGGTDTATIDCNLIQTTGKTLAAGNGVTGSGTNVTVVNGIVTAIS